MYTLKELNQKIESCWILPDGTVYTVPMEQHDNYLPDGYKTVNAAEKACCKFSCGWNFSAPISCIYLPDNLTIYQAQRLVEIEDSIQANINEYGMKSLKDIIR